MNKDFIKQILTKRGVEVDHWVGFYNRFPDGEWFEPNNKKDESFTVAMQMHDFGLLEKKRIPTWLNGSFIGYRIHFKKLS